MKTRPEVVRHAAWLCLSAFEHDICLIIKGPSLEDSYSSNQVIFLGLLRKRPPFYVKEESSFGLSAIEVVW